MTTPIKSILSCLVILATASDMHTKEMRELGESQTLALSQGQTIIFGEGMDPSQLPIFAYSSSLPGDVEVDAYLQPNRHCYFTPFTEVIATSVVLKTVKQLTSNKLASLWTIIYVESFDTIVLIVNMEQCDSNVLASYSSPLLPPISSAMVSFVNGFGIITSQNNILRFDIDGKQLSDQPQVFPVNSNYFSVSVLDGTGIDGYYIVDLTNQLVKFTKLDEAKKEWKNANLLYLTDGQVLTNNEQSLYSACGFNPRAPTRVTCYQFNKLNEMKIIHSVDLESDTVLDVKSLAGGGLVFVAFKSNGNKLSFVKIQSTYGDHIIWSYTAEDKFEEARLMGFSEKDQTFDLAYKIHISGGITEAVLLQKFSLEK